ncbi:Quinonprotein alcohol dehydrogenase-like-superfamily [Corchorus olitorius]|uniref:Quinonprotein alcohol dehydrogenase-like-superfamily n=1 Tax=Corchorus olitorius TaxID=93759 RepID=A0A1R3JIK6_9ROSI|nr:Quinonprotein alcohol dehydrogenase-like-superfamily [Corchorus olitorius]
MPAIHFLSFFIFMVAFDFRFSQSTWPPNSPPYTHLFSGQAHFTTPNRLSKPLIRDDGRIYACSDNMLFAFENNGSIAWSLPLSFKCNMSKAPVHGGRAKIYLIAENRLVKINTMKIATSEPASQILFGPGPGQQGGDEIIGFAVSTLSSIVLINVKNRGLFAYMTRGQLLWSAGPVLNQYGYKQGCKNDVLDCYFASVPVIDQCEATVYISNTKGELYSMSIRSPHCKWIQDLSSFDKVYTVTPGNNGRLYVTIPAKSLILALDVSSGNVLWHNSIGPLSSAETSPVVDFNGWVTIGSLDGFLYSFSPTGTLKKFPKAAALDHVIQFSPFLDCSGYAIYFCQTEMEGKVVHTNDQYTYVSAMKPKGSVFTLMVPATGKTYWSESHHGPLLSSLSKSDLQNFVLDEGMLLAFATASQTGNPLTCRSKDQKLASSCSQGTRKRLSIYTGNPATQIASRIKCAKELNGRIVTSLPAVRFCCIFWRKKKVRDQDLGRFLEKRRCLQLKKKEFDRTITELEQKAAGDAVANEAIEKLGDLVRERQGIERKLSTTYSLGRDRAGSKSKSLLPLYGGRSRSYSFQGAKKESVTFFHTLSNTCSEESSSDEWETTSSDYEEVEEPVDKGKAKAAIETESSSEGEQLGRKYQSRRSPSEPFGSCSRGYMNSLSVEQESGHDHEEEVVESLPSSSRSIWLKRRRNLSSSN